MRFPVYSYDEQPGSASPKLRKSYAYCQEPVEQGTHFWLPRQRDGVQAYPPRSTESTGDELLLGIAKDGAMDFQDTIYNATGVADEKRAALRRSGKLDIVESLAMQKNRNYQTAVDPETKKKTFGVKAWSDCVRCVSEEELKAMVDAKPRFLTSVLKGTKA